MTSEKQKQLDDVAALLRARQEHIRSARESIEKTLSLCPALSTFLASASGKSDRITVAGPAEPPPQKHYMTPLKRETHGQETYRSIQSEVPAMPLSPRTNNCNLSAVTTARPRSPEKLDAFYEGISQRLEPCRCCEANILSSPENVEKIRHKISPKSYEFAIRSVKKELQERIINEMRGEEIDVGEISLEQMCKLVTRLKGKGAKESPELAGRLWEILCFATGDATERVPADLIHDVLLILAGTLAFDSKSAARVLIDYLKKCGNVQDLNDGGETQQKVERVVRESRVYLVDRLAYKPIKAVRESELAQWAEDHDQHFTFHPDVNRISALLDSRAQSTEVAGWSGCWEDRYNSLMSRKMLSESKKAVVRQQADEKVMP